jgi:peptide/nickel transport system substrate-binding protein
LQPSNADEARIAAPSKTSKTLTLGQLASIKAFTPEEFSNTSGGGPSLAEVYLAGLVTGDSNGELIPRIAARLPTLDDGTIEVLPDGKMRTTWKLRSDVRWHDGAPFTAEDVAFSWQVVAEPTVLAPGPGAPVKLLVASVEAPDATTAVVTWKSPYIHALDMGALQLWLMPRHVLAASFDADKQSFLSQPFFTTDLVSLGPFRLVDFGSGETMAFERFDSYFLGPAKIDRIVIRAISDPSTLLVNLRAGSIELMADRTLPATAILPLSLEWAQSGAGRVMSRQDNWSYLWVQMNQEIAQPPELARDARLRRGLMFGFDRNALREYLFPGVPGTSADTFVLDGDPRGAVVGRPFARYPYDVERAQREFSDGGWRRSADGRLLTAAGDQVRIELRGDPPYAPDMAAVAGDWRLLGIDVAEVQVTPLLQRDTEYTAHFPAFLARARGTGDTIFVNFDGRALSSAANRWAGANHGHYANAELDRMIDRLNGALDERTQAGLLRDMGEIMASELPAFPMYFRVSFAGAVRGVHALDDYAGTRGPGSAPGLMSRNAHLWDRDS